MAINWNRRKYTKEEFIDVVLKSQSWRQVAIALNQNPNAGGIYYSLKAAAHELELDTSHFVGQGWNKGDKMGLSKRNTIPLDEVLVEHSTYTNTSKLKRRLIKEGLLDEKCSAPFCPLPDPSINPFTGEPTKLKLSLDHINGNRLDNRLDNLRLLCYHCHGMTETWCGSNKVRYESDNSSWGRPFGEPSDLGSDVREISVAGSTPVPSTTCKCGNKKEKKSNHCIECEYSSRKGKLRPNSRKIDWPNVEEIISLLKENNYLRVAEKLGVSDTAIRKHLRSNGINPKTLELESEK